MALALAARIRNARHVNVAANFPLAIPRDLMTNASDALRLILPAGAKASATQRTAG